MTFTAPQPPVPSPKRSRWNPPVFPEHGAWVMLYAPLLIGLLSGAAFALGPTLCLIVAATGIALARHTTGVFLRRRGYPALTGWLAAYALASIAALVPLLLNPRYIGLLIVGAAAFALFMAHALFSLLPGRKRMDHTEAGEILAAAGMALTAPAGRIVAGVPLDATAWLLWGACVLFFSGSIFCVKMVMKALKMKGTFSEADRWRAGRDQLLYHLNLALFLLALVLYRHDPYLYWLIGFAPVIYRSFARWRGLTNARPNFKRLGSLEAAYTLWFALWIAFSMR